MLSKYECKEFNKKISAAYNHYVFRFKQIKEAHKNNYISNLAPGALIPSDNFILLDGEFKEEAEKLCKETKDKVTAELTRAKNLIADEITAPPSADAVNVITLLNLRTDLEQEELDAIYTKYGSNVQVFKTLEGIARKHNLIVKYTNDTEEQNGLIDGLIRDANTISVHEAEQGNQVSNGLNAMRQMAINNAFPTEE